MSPRIRLSFSRAPPAYPNHTEFMFLINDKICKTVLDVEFQIKNTFKVTTAMELKIDGFLLLKSEDVKVLQHDDIVTILFDDHLETPGCREKSCNIMSRTQSGKATTKSSFSSGKLGLFATANSGDDVCDELEQISKNEEHSAQRPVVHETAIVPPESDSPNIIQSQVCVLSVDEKDLNTEKPAAFCHNEGRHPDPRSSKLGHVDTIKNLFMDNVSRQDIMDTSHHYHRENSVASEYESLEEEESQHFHLNDKLMLGLSECNGYRSSTAEDIKDMGEFLKHGITKLTQKRKSLLESSPTKVSKIE